jgi:uncharacterized membrane protein
MSTPDFTLLLLAMAAASFFCRAIGFLAMRYVPITPRIEAALRATPIAVMAGIVTVTALRGGPAEWLAAVATIIAMRLTGQDVLSALLGVAVLAICRHFGL